MKKRECYVSSMKEVPNPNFPNSKRWELVEDREFIWTFHGWGVDYDPDNRCEYTVAIVEAECGKVAMIRADWIRFLPE